MNLGDIMLYGFLGVTFFGGSVAATVKLDHKLAEIERKQKNDG